MPSLDDIATGVVIGSGFTTTSFSPGANCVLAFMVGGHGNSGCFNGITVTSSPSQTWTSRAVGAGGLDAASASVHTCTIGSDPGSMTITWTPGDTVQQSVWVVLKGTGYHPTTMWDGAAAKHTGAGDGLETVGLGANSTGNDVVGSLCYINADDTATCVVGTGWEEIHSFGSLLSLGGGGVERKAGFSGITVPWSDVCVTAGAGINSSLVAIILRGPPDTNVTRRLVRSTVRLA